MVLGLAWSALASAGETGHWVYLANARLNTGAVPELHFAPWPVDRTAAVYVRTGAGRVVALDLKDGPVLRVRSGPERRFWVGGSSGYFAVPRSGKSVDREALIVLVVAGAVPDLGGLAPIARALVPDNAPQVDLFFRRLAKASWIADVETHIVPYEISAERNTSETVRIWEEGRKVLVSFSGFPLDRVLSVADILSVETGGVPAPVFPVRLEGAGRVEMRVGTVLGADHIASLLEAIVADLDAVSSPVAITSAPGKVSVTAEYRSPD
ncbi:hypothetical protein NUH88_05995 [Nisaea acidiphila]|uniref:Uncharacterized protein n=1 Tax=Nisaea acidiphila TaxID=1862145 RepID=A0A9J7AXS7_9PROT|nr:hypothetical protein [Nisaea acidiphila]UUX51241.1 hypothetical protein NUH88_05995 [Nisaea acidiphila]